MVRKWLAALPLPIRSRPLIVGVSGGLDSMVLLDLLAETAPKLSQRLTVAHAHHGLRGPDADADADLVATRARQYGIPYVTHRLPVRDEHRGTAESLEMTARRLRHDFLARTARELGAPAIALAHHADDQVELILLRLFRGTGGDGLGGMSPLNPSPADPEITLLRPLLRIPRRHLLEYAGERQLEFREDTSNLDLTIPRNLIRHTVLPWLRTAVGPHLDRVLLRTSTLVGTESEYVQDAADRWLKSSRPSDFARLHPALQRAVVRRQLWDRGYVPDFDLVERLRSTEARHTASQRRQLQRSSLGHVAEIEAATTFLEGCHPITLGSRGCTAWAGLLFEWRTLAGPGHQPPVHSSTLPSRLLEDFDRAAVGSEVQLRHWRPGDRFRPLGLPRPTKLQDLFLNRKIPAAERRRRVLATTQDGTIFWVEGLPPGDDFKVHLQTRQRLRWVWRREGSE